MLGSVFQYCFNACRSGAEDKNSIVSAVIGHMWLGCMLVAFRGPRVGEGLSVHTTHFVKREAEYLISYLIS
jgi:hypothetical protein